MYYIREQNEDRLNPQKNAAFACDIKGNPTRESASNVAYSPQCVSLN